eukprot:TRINITY_DN10125_c0_g1_i1.p2 TRINITY_DN10125_c0_g1~~TRINITY_DN10125_c0_g1_i1.p2  ORF type:complete len:128 (-),score=16.58 TRINITY_DN10125_c0_g1_i1:42-425(-)
MRHDRVPRGTNGGISMLGTLASLLGGLVIGLTAFFFFFLMVRPHRFSHWPVLIIGSISGVFGSLVDSLLGATLQYSGFDPDLKVVVEVPSDKTKLVSGRRILDNNQVNFISACLTTVASAFLSAAFL